MIRLHHAHQTRSMRVLWMLEELELDYDLEVRPFDKTLRAPDFLVLSPAGRVPALEIDGEVMFESLAMLQYLAARFSERGLGRDPDDPDWPDWLQWLNFAETISQHVASLTQQHIMLYEDAMRSPTVMKLEAARIGKCYDALEARLSTPVENRDYLLTSGFSATDIACGQSVYMARHFRGTEGHLEVSAWYERLAERPAFRAALPPEGAPRLYGRDFYEVPGG